MSNRDIRSYDLSELCEIVEKLGEPKFRAKQIYSWLHQKYVTSFEEMSNLSKDLRQKLQDEYEVFNLKVADVLESKIDGTCKFLFELHDNNIIESVFMRYKHGNSVCISSQVGCRMGCRFCASTIDGLARNLYASEMLAQVYEIEKYTKEKVSNVVVMGSGEPLDNFDNLVRFIELISSKDGKNISQRNITVSTCGIVPMMDKLAEHDFSITLALSLHGSNQEKRKSLMPIANKYELSEVLKACQRYYEKTGRRITFEYSLVAGVNDTINDAKELVEITRNMNCHINLIPVNPIKERTYKQSIQKDIDYFKNYLEKSGRNVTIRREMGRDINGACGQLRRSYLNNA